MGFQCGIVGLPNVGKSTLFNALTRSSIRTENYPFCTIDPNIGVVEVPDPRLRQLADLVRPQRSVPAHTEFLDIAGLVSGASQGEGLGNQFLGHVRGTQAIAQVVRCFEDSDITHVAGKVDPVSDMETINTELCLADQQTTERVLEKTRKLAKSGDKDMRERQAALEAVMAHLDQGLRAGSLDLPEEQRPLLGELQLLTAKPMLYVANVAEGEHAQDNPLLAGLRQRAAVEQVPVLPVCVAMEAEIARLDEDDQNMFLAEADIAEPGLSRVIRAGYELLGLHTYFTAGSKETRAWTIPQGATAQQAAGVIHSDFARGFIRAEVVSFDDYLACGGEQGAKADGKWRSEGKDYVVMDGDVILFRFNV